MMALPAALVRLRLADEICGVAVPLVAQPALICFHYCWLGRGTADASAIPAILTYNIPTTLYLLYLGIEGGRVGLILWPAMALHALLSFLPARKGRSDKAR
jgi:hypothetical protein